ncbi:hypothetical protein ACFLRI_01790 [Bacteroidota bacterium]
MIHKQKFKLNILIWITLFSIAMGLLECAVVIYLREIYYPEGFAFPLKSIEGNIALTEILREAATLIMLVSIGILAGKNFYERFAYFILSFAIWDISYYIFLKILIGWPESLMTWDILFLIPAPWVGPVIAPVILSILMTVFALLIIYFNQFREVAIKRLDWILLILGSVIVIVSFIWDYMVFMLEQFSIPEVLSLTNRNTVLAYSTNYIPEQFVWWPFILGSLIISSAIFAFYKRNLMRHDTRPR